MELQQCLLENKAHLYKQLDSLDRVNDAISLRAFLKIVSKKQYADYHKVIADEANFININYKSKRCNFILLSAIPDVIHKLSLHNYENVCEYFGVKPQNKLKEQLKAIIAENNMSKLLRWLYDKPKSISYLSKMINRDTVISWILKVEDDINEEKKNTLLEYYGVETPEKQDLYFKTNIKSVVELVIEE
jgi:hypothetical protein